ncbi:unnamed protein product [Phytophthora lilii]|uniref:Unnamed protein product n=1 Tax=Phytophthora lilii TaxID=2077276 RepID=A0A9W6TZI7_9STRA|nr:unnamed protein product [Phytophthora lilii]
MATRQDATNSLRTPRTEQEIDDDDDVGSGSPRTVDMSFISNVTSFVDGSGVGHVKVNDSMDWSDVLPNDTTVHIVYEGSGSTREILIVPVNESASDSKDSSSGSSGSGSMGNSTVSPVNSLPTGSSASNSSSVDEGVIGTGSNATIIVIVASILAVIAIAAVVAVVLYGRRNRRRAYSENPSNPDEPFIVGSLPHQPAPQLSILDTDITPDLWVEGQYQYSPNMSRLQNSLNGTAILSDNNTTPSHHRLTVDAYPFSGNTQRGRRDNALEDISERGHRRTGTTPIVLYEQNSIEERKTNSSRRQQPQSRRQPSQSHSQRPQQQQQQQQRMSRRDIYATRRDR